MPLAHGERLRRLDKTPRALGIFFDIHVVPSACRFARRRDQQKWRPVLRPIAPPILNWRVILSRNRPTLSRITREAQKRHLHWGSARRIDVPQPGAGRHRAQGGPRAGLRQRGGRGVGKERGDPKNWWGGAARPGTP